MVIAFATVAAFAGAVGEVPGAVTFRERGGRRIGSVVLDDEHLDVAARGLAGHGGQRDLEVVAAPAGRDDDRDDRGHARLSIDFALA